MLDLFYQVDKSLFTFLNQTIANYPMDIAMPFLTDLNKIWIGWAIYIGLWLWLFIKGGKRGKTAALLILPLIFFSDQLSSNILKFIFERQRPCHSIDGVMVVENVRLLVSCGSGYSFPSSHAVNNFAAATLFGHFFRKWLWVFFLIASVVGFSRIYVGVHYPSDIIGGGLIGIACAYLILFIWKKFCLWFPSIRLQNDFHQ